MTDEPSPTRLELCRVLIVGDDPLARRAIARTLRDREGIAVVAQTATDAAFEEAVEETKPDAVIWDLGPGGEGAEEFWIDVEVPVVALLDAMELAGDVLRNGASGVLTREVGSAQLELTLQGVALGLTILENPLPPELLGPPSTTLSSAIQPGALTAREGEVLELLAEGLSNRQIAERLDISAHTAKFHVNAILSKLHARTRTEAVVTAAREGLLRL